MDDGVVEPGSWPSSREAAVAGQVLARPSDPEPVEQSDVELERLLTELVSDLDPEGTGTVAISVAWADQTVSVNGDRAVDSASSAKLYWAAAALAAAPDPEALEADGLAAFEVSDNDAAGRLIDAAGGVDAVNAFTAFVGLEATSLSAWSYGIDRQASDRADRGLDNITSTDELVRFATALSAGDLLDDDRRQVLLRWMTSTPDDLASSNGLDGVLTDRLPAPVAAATAHKAGWLRPGCCTRIRHVVVAVGIVPRRDGEHLRVAVAAQDSPDFDRAVGWLSEAVCRVWVAVERLDVTCVPTQE